MSLSIHQSKTALAPGFTAFFLGVGGLEPYVYSVLPGGAGGTIDPASGLYTAPVVVNPDPKKSNDIIQVIDLLGATASAPILVTTPIGLVCEIIEREMGLSSGRVYFWDQKIFQPTDSDLFVAVSTLRCKPFANSIFYDGASVGLNAVQSVNMLGQLSIDVISRGPAARDRKEEILLALGSSYAQSQQEMNNFFIGKIPPGGQFVNLSNLDGSAIPYRFNIAINIQYMMRKLKPVQYYDTFSNVEVTTNP